MLTKIKNNIGTIGFGLILLSWILPNPYWFLPITIGAILIGINLFQKENESVF